MTQATTGSCWPATSPRAGGSAAMGASREERPRARPWVVPMAACAAAILLLLQPGLAAAAGPLFPTPFVVEHAVVQTDADGSTFATEPVTDYYGGSLILSVRPDGSRMVVDFSRRELTEIRADRGTYSVLGFGRFAELARRLYVAESAPGGAAQAAVAQPAGGGDDAVPLEVREVPVRRGLDAKSGAVASAADSLLDRPGVRHLQVSPQGATPDRPGLTLDVWLDPRVRLSPDAQDALAAFEREVVGAAAEAKQARVSTALAAARAEGDGALPIRTSRPLKVLDDGTALGSVDDVATRLEVLEAFPLDLAAVPEGLERTAHPLELMVAFAEEEAERNARALAATASP